MALGGNAPEQSSYLELQDGAFELLFSCRKDEEVAEASIDGGIAGCAAVVASMLHFAGIDLAAADKSQLVDEIVNIAGALGGLLAVYG
ncbi:hypothetical protein EV291_11925 [Rhizobium sp. BK068]|nr:hypothetical protein EV291_11925 [Rhizobium sp. BK068]